MSAQSEYESQTAAMIDICDARIDALSTCAREGAPAVAKVCRDEIAMLIANREAVKRGLVSPDELECLCAVCPSGPSESA